MGIERSLVLLKPDAVQRRLVGELLSRFERKGLRILGLKLLQATPGIARQHYVEHVEKPFYPHLESFITAGPLVALVLSGPDVIRVIRQMVGPTNGRDALPGTMRGDFGMSRQMNLVHASDSPAAAEREIAIYFQPHELVTSELALSPWLTAPDEA